MFDALAITQMQALVWGLLTLPLTAWVIWTDLTDMRIRNQTVLAMLAVFVVTGPFLLAFPDYLWRYAYFAVTLVVCFGLSVLTGLGAGDAKYVAAVAPMVALPDLPAIGALFIMWSVILLVFFFVAKRLPVVQTAYPNWIWTRDDRKGHVAFGLALAPTVTSYFALGALG